MRTFKHQKKSTPRIRERGFTLIEVMIAMLVFTIGILAASVMSTRGFTSFTRGRTVTDEVNRSIKNIDALGCTSYTNNQIFTQGGQSPTHPFGVDQTDLNSWDFDNVVVQNTKLIIVENSTFRGPTASNDYRLYMVKSARTQVQ